MNPDPLTDAGRWDAVAGRRPGAFVYGVRTTGVYCRPDCPSRRPNRGNVAFFPGPADAERAGFRACKKCDPRAAAAGPDPAVLAACRRLDSADDAPTLAELAAGAGLSPFHFHRLFKRSVGVTPKAYAVARRAERFRAAIAAGTGVTEATYAAGFGASSRVYDGGPAMLGMTPGEYKAGGAGRRIRYAVAPCSLGRVIVAATDIGVCCIALGDADDALIAELARRFPRAERVPADAELAEWVAAVASLVETPAAGLNLPLDVQGTAFQRRVWDELRRIPAGATVSYSALAARLGHPTATRAVAAACGANPVAIVVPCHRVVGANGALTGYRWGVGRKRELLRRECLSPPLQSGEGAGG